MRPGPATSRSASDRQIVRAATELVLEDGYERATIARIAERADLATRTVTSRFHSKEDIFFEGARAGFERAAELLESADGNAIDRLRTWIDEMAAQSQNEPEDSEIRLLRSRAVAADPDLRARFSEHFNRAHDAIAGAVAADSGHPADSIGPQMIAAAAISMLSVLERLAAAQSPETGAELERGFDVLRGALRTLAPAS
jgi:AcrR family transcriptional regulator